MDPLTAAAWALLQGAAGAKYRDLCNEYAALTMRGRRFLSAEEQLRILHIQGLFRVFEPFVARYL